jgi:hypothetical protein
MLAERATAALSATDRFDSSAGQHGATTRSMVREVAHCLTAGELASLRHAAHSLQSLAELCDRGWSHPAVDGTLVREAAARLDEVAAGRSGLHQIPTSLLTRVIATLAGEPAEFSELIQALDALCLTADNTFQFPRPRRLSSLAAA